MDYIDSKHLCDFRIFKLARRSVGLQSIAHTVRTSWKDLGLLFMLVGMGMLVFGSLEYYIENAEPNTGFTSIPQVLRSESCDNPQFFPPHRVCGGRCRP